MELLQNDVGQKTRWKRAQNHCRPQPEHQIRNFARVYHCSEVGHNVYGRMRHLGSPAKAKNKKQKKKTKNTFSASPGFSPDPRQS
jgi:hypothetical protein